MIQDVSPVSIPTLVTNSTPIGHQRMDTSLFTSIDPCQNWSWYAVTISQLESWREAPHLGAPNLLTLLRIQKALVKALAGVLGVR